MNDHIGALHTVQGTGVAIVEGLSLPQLVCKGSEVGFVALRGRQAVFGVIQRSPPHKSVR